MINRPNIVRIIEGEGFELKQKGRNFWACCPLHSEKTPSFMVNPEKQNFKCYGCHEYGDVVDFIQKYRKLSFKDALGYLGISGWARQIKLDSCEIKRRELMKGFHEWCSNYTKWLCEILRLGNQIDAFVCTPDNLEVPGLSEMYFMRDVYKHHLFVLEGSDAESKFRLYEGIAYGRRV